MLAVVAAVLIREVVEQVALVEVEQEVPLLLVLLELLIQVVAAAVVVALAAHLLAAQAVVVSLSLATQRVSAQHEQRQVPPLSISPVATGYTGLLATARLHSEVRHGALRTIRREQCSDHSGGSA